MSGEISGGYKNMWHSFDYDPVHVIMLNTETDFVSAPAGPGTTLNADHFVDTSAHVTWVEADLKKATDPAQRAKVSWIIATGHRSLLGSSVVATLKIGKILSEHLSCRTTVIDTSSWTGNYSTIKELRVM